MSRINTIESITASSSSSPSSFVAIVHILQLFIHCNRCESSCFALQHVSSSNHVTNPLSTLLYRAKQPFAFLESPPDHTHGLHSPSSFLKGIKFISSKSTTKNCDSKKGICPNDITFHIMTSTSIARPLIPPHSSHLSVTS